MPRDTLFRSTSMTDPSSRATQRRVWLIYPDVIGKVLTGPSLRIMEIARQAAARGHQVTLSTSRCDQVLPAGVTWMAGGTGIVKAIEPGDAVLVSGEVSGRMVWTLCRRGVPFHVDAYNVTAIEVLELRKAMPSERAWRTDLYRRWLRYLALWGACEKGYVSTPAQAAFLGGSAAFLLDPSWPRFSGSLPEKSEIAPMGISSQPPPQLPNPYPSILRNRPILLWGGGIWSWFDVESLLEGMAELKRRGSDAALWFLAGKNPSGMAIHDEPFHRARAKAEELGLLGGTVFFGEESVSVENLPAYLNHCAAGVMSNPPRLEAWCSWRTRILDLIWVGKPLFTIGYDPLSQLLCQLGAGRSRECGDAVGFADDVQECLADPARLSRMARASLAIGSTMTWEKTIHPILRSFDSPECFRRRGAAPSWLWLVRFLSGL